MPGPQWPTYIFQLGFRTPPDRVTSWLPSVQTHEPVGTCLIQTITLPRGSMRGFSFISLFTDFVFSFASHTQCYCPGGNNGCKCSFLYSLSIWESPRWMIEIVFYCQKVTEFLFVYVAIWGINRDNWEEKHGPDLRTGRFCVHSLLSQTFGGWF